MLEPVNSLASARAKVPFARLVLLAAAGSLAHDSLPLSAQWPIKQFEVVQIEPATLFRPPEAFRSGGAVDRVMPRVGEDVRSLADVFEGIRRLERQLGGDPDWRSVVERYFWSYFDEVPFHDEARAELEALLHESAVELERWGFPPPALEPVVTRDDRQQAYRVYIVSGLEPISGHEPVGVYHPNICDRFFENETLILLNADLILTGGHVNPFSRSAAPHELFHAVQAALPFRGCGRGGIGSWIVEGQADAVGHDLDRRLRGLPEGPYPEALAVALPVGIAGVRNYSARLPVTAGERGLDAYATSSFWRYLAEREARGPRSPRLDPSGRDVDYGYLVSFLQTGPSALDCIREGDACRAEITWLDDWLQRYFREDLRAVYAHFIGAYMGYAGLPADVMPAPVSIGRIRQVGLPPSELTELSFHSGCRPVFLHPHPDSLQVTIVADRFYPVSAQCLKVHPIGFEEEVVTVRMTARGPLGVPQLAQLTAVLSGRNGAPAIVDTATVVQNATLPSATWYYELPNDEPSHVLLTNVAPAAATTRPLPDLNVTLTAVRSRVAMNVGTGGGPTPAEIDDTALIEFRTVQGNVFPAPKDPEVCVFRLSGLTDRTNRLNLQLDHHGPIGPGVYGIASWDRPVFVPPEQVVGRFIGGFAIGKDHILADGHAQEFWLQSGVVEITSVTDRLVTGVVAATGWRRRCCLPGPQIGVEYGRESLAVSARFAFFANERTPGSPATRNRLALFCLDQPPPLT